MKLGKVYHWSPTANREKILKEGLTILNSSIEYENSNTGEKEVWKPPYLCTSLDPWTAYVYVAPMIDATEVPSLDLFYFELAETDDVVIRNDRTIEIIEVRVLNSIPADRVHYLATRETDT